MLLVASIGGMVGVEILLVFYVSWTVVRFSCAGGFG